MAVMNNGYPMGFQSYYQQPVQAQLQPQTAAVNQNGTGYGDSRLWVQGESGMRSYLMAPNSIVVLWDLERPVIYLKSSDAFGMVSVKTLDYTVRETDEKKDSASYATKEDVEALTAQLNKLQSRFNNMNKREG